MGYEFKSSRDYTHRNPNSRVEYIDISVFVNGKEEFVEGCTEIMKSGFQQVVGEPEIVKLLLERLDGGVEAYLDDLRGQIQQSYQNAEEMAEMLEIFRDPEIFEMMKGAMPPQAVQALEQIFNPQRDEAMETRIRGLYNNQEGTLIAVVGLAHLAGLKIKLEDLEPIVMTLAEYDSV